MRFDITLGDARPVARPAADAPFRILVLGDFDARTSRNLVQPLADRHPTPVDVDNLEAVLQRLGADVQLGPTGVSPIHVVPSGIDDLHPDHLVARMDQFTALRTTRQRLLDASTFDTAAAEVRAWCVSSPTGTPPASSPARRESDAATIERLFGRLPSTGATSNRAATDLIRRVVAPHIVAAPAGDQVALVAAVDAALAELMRPVLQDPGFRALESAWRGIDFLVRRLETGESLTVSLLNLSRAELEADLRAGAELRRSALFHILAESTARAPGAEPWALLLGLYPFGPRPDDVELLGRLAQLARAAGAPFVASADDAFRELALQDPRPANGFLQGWTALRGQPEAAYVGLCCPRVLLRPPYGRSTEPIATFAFEEFAGRPEPAGYLWGHPALALGVLLGRAFVESGWEMSPGAEMELGELPVHTWKEGAEARLAPCAEEWLTDAQAEQLLAFGLMPLQSIRGRDAVRLTRAQSIRQPLTGLAGRWDLAASA